MTTRARLADPLWSRVTSGDLGAESCRLAQTRLPTEAYILAIKLHYRIRDTSLGWDTYFSWSWYKSWKGLGGEGEKGKGGGR